MNNKETAAEIRKYYAEGMNSIWSWPTDCCGYDQHVRFVQYRNKNWAGGTPEEFKAFTLAYADMLEAELET